MKYDNVSRAKNGLHLNQEYLSHVKQTFLKTRLTLLRYIEKLISTFQNCDNDTIYNSHQYVTNAAEWYSKDIETNLFAEWCQFRS